MADHDGKDEDDYYLLFILLCINYTSHSQRERYRIPHVTTYKHKRTKNVTGIACLLCLQ